MEIKMKSVILQTGLSEKAIRLYIDKELVHPIEKNYGNRRNFFFDKPQIERLKEIALLRKYDFSLNEIKCLYDTPSCIDTILLEYKKRISHQYDYYKNIEENLQNNQIEHADHVGVLIKQLCEMEQRKDINKTYTMFFDEELDEVSVSKKRFTPIHFMILIAGAFVLLFIGAEIGNWRSSRYRILQDNILEYGVAEQDFSIRNVSWKEYPSYRELAFTIDGMISFRLHQDGTVTLDGLADSSVFREIDREHCVSSDGNDVLYYDLVSYSLSEGKITVNLPKIYHDNAIRFIKENSYYLTFHDNDMDYTVGCISCMDTKYTPWNADEIKYAAVNLDAYLPAFILSGTYDSVNPLHQRSPKDGVILNKKGGSGFHYTIHNDMSNDWCYENQLPHIELWYKGIWIELISPFDYNLTNNILHASETKESEIPKELIKQYPETFQGIYRLVIYGENQEFIVSDTFLYGGFE